MFNKIGHLRLSKLHVVFAVSEWWALEWHLTLIHLDGGTLETLIDRKGAQLAGGETGKSV